MSVKVTPYWEGYICALSDAKFSASVIVKMCSARGNNISRRTVARVIQRCKSTGPKYQDQVVRVKRKRACPARTPRVVRNIRAAVVKENPPTQSSLATACRTSQSTVCRIIKDNLGLKKRHKAKGHKLSPRHIQERFTNARKLYEQYLAGDKWQWVVTQDEAWIYLDDTNKPRAIYYSPHDAKGRGEFVRECREKFSKGFMVVAGFCARGKLPMHRVDSKAKVNALYFQTNIMEPLCRTHIPQLYGSDTRKVWIHMHKASSHTSHSSVAYYRRMATETGVSVIPFSSIPVKSPDASPMDFCAFGLLKRGLAHRRPTTIAGLWKACQAVWSSIPLTHLRRALLQWKLRCRAIVQARGHHIEHNRWWRKGLS